MLNFNISFTSLAVILWSGMLIISGSIWVLSSQVRRLGDLLEQQGKAGIREAQNARSGLRGVRPSIPRGTIRRVVERSAARVN